MGEDVGASGGAGAELEEDEDENVVGEHNDWSSPEVSLPRLVVLSPSP